MADGRGGYCYEQNLLLGSVLEALGFKFRHLTGWPRWQVAPGRLLPRTHLLLLVDDRRRGLALPMSASAAIR